MTEEKRASLPNQSPRSWHGMTARVWFRMLARNRFAISPSRVPMSTIISGLSVMNSGLRLVSEALYGRRAARVELPAPPLLVVGHWRTGTTWLHELMVKDERMSFPSTYQCMAPHHFLLTDGTLSRLVDALLPRKRPMDDMAVGASRPQEDEFALMNLGLDTPYLEWAFPNHGWRYDDYLTLVELTDEERRRWRKTFEWFVRRVTLRQPGRLVLKSPTHTARLRTIRESYPEARFVHVVRNPFDFIPSTIRTWRRMTDALSLQVRKQEISADRVLDVFERMYTRFEEDRVSIPDSHLIDVRYEDLVQDPLGVMEHIYRALDLGDFEPARGPVQDYLDRISDYRPNKLDLAEDLRQRIVDRCGDYMRRYGYDSTER